MMLTRNAVTSPGLGSVRMRLEHGWDVKGCGNLGSTVGDQNVFMYLAFASD